MKAETHAVAHATISAKIGVSLLIAGPVLGSVIRFGGLTLDNVLLLIGLPLVALNCLSLGFLWGREVVYPITITLAVLLSAVANDGEGMAAFGRGLGYTVLAVGLANGIVSAAFLRRLMLFVLGVGAVSILLQPMTQFPSPFAVEEFQTIVRYGGLFGHPNFASYCLVLAVIWLLVDDVLVGAVRVGVIALFLAPLALTQSLAAILVGAVLAPLAVRNKRRRLGTYCAVATGGAVLLFLERSRLEYILQGNRGNSLSWRLAQWSELWAESSDFRWWGFGFGRSVEVARDGLGAHSGYVQVAVELGFVGSVLIIAGITFGLLRRNVDPGFHVLTAYVLITSLTDPNLIFPSIVASLLVYHSLLSRGGLYANSNSVSGGSGRGELSRPRLEAGRSIELAGADGSGSSRGLSS